MSNALFAILYGAIFAFLFHRAFITPARQRPDDVGCQHPDAGFTPPPFFHSSQLAREAQQNPHAR